VRSEDGDQTTTGGPHMEPASAPVIDCHAHAVPAALLASLCETLRGINGFDAQSTEQGWLVDLPGGGASRLVRPKMGSSEMRDHWLQDQGISGQMLSPWMDVQPTAAMTAADARDWSRRLNAALLDEAGRSPGAALALATVALNDPDVAAGDLVDAARVDGMSGLVLSTNPVGVADLGDLSLDPLWAAAAELGVPVMLHPPSDGPSRSLPGSKEFGNTYCRLVDTTFAVAKLILSGVLDRHPLLKLVAVHGGGFLPFQSARLDGGHRADGLVGYSLERGHPSAYLGDLYYDTVAMSAPAIRFLVDAVGADRLLLGSDYPFPLGDQTPALTVRDAGLTDAATIAILSGNAHTLIPGSVHV
jgi:aminocarboxymuconate-semialdehyde decarboxylase